MAEYQASAGDDAGQPGWPTVPAAHGNGRGSGANPGADDESGREERRDVDDQRQP